MQSEGYIPIPTKWSLGKGQRMGKGQYSFIRFVNLYCLILFYRSAEGWDHREATEEHGSQTNKYKIQQKFPADDTNNENKKQ